MPSKINLTLGTALAGIALCCFVESSFAQDALVASLDATENDDRDAEDKDDKDDKSRQASNTYEQAVCTQSGFADNGPVIMCRSGLTNVAETAEAERRRRYRKSFDIYPVPVSRVAAS